MTDHDAARLVLHLGLDGPRAAVYPLDATPYSTPLVTFRLREDQVLPPIAPGARVGVEGELRAGARPTFWVDGVAILPVGPLEDGRASHRLFAERGDIIGDPRVIGWDRSWRSVVPMSRLDVESWETHLRKARRDGVIAAVMTVLAILATVITALMGRPRVVFLAAVVPAAAAALRAWRHARRAKRALDDARRNQATNDGRWLEMTMWWAAGTVRGPQAVVSLRDTDTSRLVAQVPVLGVPDGYVPAPGHLVRVVGEPAQAPVIHDGAVALWPAEHARLSGPRAATDP